MKKEIIYTNKDNEDFTVTTEDCSLICGTESQVVFTIRSGGNRFYFLDFKEIEEFCEILKEEGKKTFNIQ
jgi:hypothetical protein